MTKPIDYLRTYASKYFVVRLEDRTVEIRTKWRIPETGRDWCSVYLFSDTHLGVVLPRRVGYRLQRELPDTFSLHQDADDGVTLLFSEDKLHDLADTLKLRRRRKPLTPEQVEAATARLESARMKIEQATEGFTAKISILAPYPAPIPA